VFETTEPKAIFEDGHTNKNINKMSSDTRSVLDLKKTPENVVTGTVV